MRPVHPSSEPGPVHIGAKLRTSRLAQGMTLEQLAAASGITKGFMSRVERDGTQPSLSSLVQICQALSMPIGSLFEEPDIQRIDYTDAPKINMGGTGASERLVTPRSEEQLQVIRSSLTSHASGGEEMYTVNCSAETLHVIEGEIDVVFPSRRERLRAGDTLTFPGRTPHTWFAGAAGAEITWTLVPAAWSGSA